MTEPVNFEIAKLLKEKGFDSPCRFLYKSEKGWEEGIGVDYNWNSFDSYSAPTIGKVVMWLYEKHGIWISVDMLFEEHQTGFWYTVRESKKDDFAVQSNEYSTISEAYEAAIEYTLNNLI